MIKLDIISGFLGAGKTTLINRLLAEAYIDEKPVLIENEFGEVSIDDQLIADPEVQVRVLSSGCICCTLQGDFIYGLVQVIEQFAPTRIIIEPTGLADPADVIKACAEAAEAVRGQDLELVLNSFITVLDLENVLPLLAVTGRIYSKQIAEAAFLLMNRGDRLSPEELAESLEEIRGLNASGLLVDGDKSGLDGLAILGMAEAVAAAGLGSAEGPGAESEGEPDHDHDDHDDEGGDHDHHDHDDHDHEDDGEFAAHVFCPERAFDEAALQQLFADLAAGLGGQVLRAKGFVRNTGGGIMHLEYVFGRGEHFTSAYVGEPRVVIIGSELDEAALHQLVEGI